MTVVDRFEVGGPVDQAVFRTVLGHYPTGVVAVTALCDGEPVGMVAGSFTSVSLDPPLVGFLPARTSTSWPRIAAAGRFAVNILADHQRRLCAALSAPGPDKFAEVDWHPGPAGPYILGAVASLDCDLHGIAEAGDHHWVTGLVRNMIVRDAAAEPMIFHRGRYGTVAVPPSG
jgi:flavin reductase (DIM6/NTAB) family NADH-FMN oxidoreductase RutF